ncbi:hypothetical protein BCR35DRAFT_15862 [Leucosporidium creatinivorum]|uniref:Uncharacterized protein n=1 Tax=Leucosporidium creatinivorum TaxID=106004 RepID=A0A1Y2FZ85_9BASI|nr:hypothetical protein BCR35DRAFT_15862 [Leucosporidium creatinivorum]
MLYTTSLALTSILSLGLGASAFPLQPRASSNETTPYYCAPSVYGYKTLITASEATSPNLSPSHSQRELGTAAPEDTIPYWTIDVGDDERGTVRITDPKSGACVVADNWGATLAGGTCGAPESEWWLTCARCDTDRGVATKCLFESAYVGRCAGYKPAEGQETYLQQCDNQGLSYPNPQTQYWDIAFDSSS